MESDMSERAEALQNLMTVLIDSRNGYEEAVEDADGKGLSILFQEMVALRTRHIEEIRQHLLALGAPAADDESFMSTVHRTVISIRAALTGLDTNVLPSLISGEERVLESYDEAMQGGDESFLAAQRSELADKIKAMEALRDKAA
jgi:uncharacterized protein (TIGR02284 family)